MAVYRGSDQRYLIAHYYEDNDYCAVSAIYVITGLSERMQDYSDGAVYGYVCRVEDLTMAVCHLWTGPNGVRKLIEPLEHLHTLAMLKAARLDSAVRHVLYWPVFDPERTDYQVISNGADVLQTVRLLIEGPKHVHRR